MEIAEENDNARIINWYLHYWLLVRNVLTIFLSLFVVISAIFQFVGTLAVIDSVFLRDSSY